ncbi:MULTISPECIES: hypothetical protein [Aquincola]|uniref:hypothetical protein n=1 Tax=Aquincola TaxID=391952 RepID=UPI00061537E2|nr:MULTISPECIES: hypothetical protein [Aquincola]MCR5864405.1 hypothetical protein [Aquincola sp. J276]
MFVLLAWLGVLCAGLGASVGLASHTLAGKLSAHVQPMQRPTSASGASQVTRSARRHDTAQVAAMRLPDARWTHAVLDAGMDALPSAVFRLPVLAQQAAQPPPVTGPPRSRQPARAHRSRAPPSLA